MKKEVYPKRSLRVFVAMSGGVDSSVAAALMKKAEFSVVGVFMKPPSYAQGSGGHKGDCNWKQDREDALRVAAKLDIPLLTWDLSKEYEKYVARYMIDGYKNGITPNPDVMCNKFIKFGFFMEKALKMGADYIATGHYVRIKQRRGPVSPEAIPASHEPSPGHPHSVQFANLRSMGDPQSGHPFVLYRAKDVNKDQSYFLYTLNQKQLSRCLFPIGDYKKDEVRKLAKKFGLPNWDKKDSQGVCFVGPIKVSQFLKDRIKPENGLVLRKSDGKILGEHDGVWFYTIGQRHGMGLSVGEPYYVVGKDIKKNILYVSENLQLTTNNLRLEDFNWIGSHKKLPLKCKVKTRYRQQDLNSTIVKNGSSTAYAKIESKNISVAPGQSAVFYKGNEVLGGGIII